MAKKKKEEKEEETPKKKPVQKKKEEGKINIKKFSISELLENYQINPLNAVGFLNYYGLSEEFKKEFETKEKVVEFSESEFENMYKRYIERKI